MHVCMPCSMWMRRRHAQVSKLALSLCACYFTFYVNSLIIWANITIFFSTCSFFLFGLDTSEQMYTYLSRIWSEMSTRCRYYANTHRETPLAWRLAQNMFFLCVLHFSFSFSIFVYVCACDYDFLPISSTTLSHLFFSFSIYRSAHTWGRKVLDSICRFIYKIYPSRVRAILELTTANHQQEKKN